MQEKVVYRDRWIRTIPDEAFNKFKSLANLKGITLGERFTEMVLEAWERETGQKAGQGLIDVKGARGNIC